MKINYRSWCKQGFHYKVDMIQHQQECSACQQILKDKVGVHYRPPSERVFGWLVVCRFRKSDGTVEEREYHTKGSESRARRIPVSKRGFECILSVEPYTKEQYIRCFGEGFETGAIR